MKLSTRSIKMLVIGLFVIFSGAAAASAVKPTSSKTTSPSVAAAIARLDLYTSNCASCHGADGRGKTPAGKKLGVRDLHSGAVQGLSDEQMHHSIALGKGKMVGFGKRLNDDQINQLVKSVRQMR